MCIKLILNDIMHGLGEEFSPGFVLRGAKILGTTEL